VILQEYTGLYKNQKGQQRIISVSEHQLYSQLGRGPKSKLSAFQKDQFFFSDDAMQTIAFSRNANGVIENLITKKLTGTEIWGKSHKPLPNENGIQVDQMVLQTYVGEYEIPSMMTFSVTREQDRLFLQGEGQDKFEIFADTETQFFTKVNDAQFQFVKDDSGKVFKAILSQGGREADARKIK
jgi:hypothetical protein